MDANSTKIENKKKEKDIIKTVKFTGLHCIHIALLWINKLIIRPEKFTIQSNLHPK